MLNFLKSKKKTESAPETDAIETIPDENATHKTGWLKRLKTGLGRTRSNFTSGLADLFLGQKAIDDELLETLETRLLSADVGIEATEEIMDNLQERISRDQVSDPQALLAVLREILLEMLSPCQIDWQIDSNARPHSVLMVGINGAGKTTTIGKLAHYFQQKHASVLLAAGDTFRAAAVEQLATWGERNHVPVIAQGAGADSASVIYDALAASKARGIDVLLADSAGRLHTQTHLMEELKKVSRVMGKLDPNAPHDTLLVLDASIGQNALRQAEEFHQAVGLTGIVVTKLDGTAKGGIIFALAKQMGLPIYFIGIGEGLDDLQPFVANEFIDALLTNDTTESD